MHRIDFNKTVYFYTNTSGYTGGVAIIQFRVAKDADIEGKSLVGVPIIYDSMTFSPTRRRYPTYKKELYVIVEFPYKYEYLAKHPYVPAVVHTDHKPLTHFLKADSHEGIYGNWADQLRRLNLGIVYIPGHRNRVADALLRTIFDEECNETDQVRETYDRLTQEAVKLMRQSGPKSLMREYYMVLPSSRLLPHLLHLGLKLTHNLSGLAIFIECS